jgi:hypothetical protein
MAVEVAPQESAPPGTPPPPNIKTDKLFVVTGGSLTVLTEPVLMTGPTPVWVTIFPQTPTGPAAGVYPRERHFRVMYDVQAGTVDELVELYRDQLTRAYHAMAMTPKEGEEQPLIPTLGEPSLRIHNEAVAKMCDSPGKAVVLCIKAGPKQYESFLAPRYEKYGEPRPRQSEFERDRLKRLVASYHNYRYPDAESENISPTDDPAKVDALIDMLTVLRQDAEVRHAFNVSRAEKEEKPEAPPPGTDVAKD